MLESPVSRTYGDTRTGTYRSSFIGQGVMRRFWVALTSQAVVNVFLRLRLIFTLVAALACEDTLAVAQGVPDLSRLDNETRQSIELACITQKADGPVAYGECLHKQINALNSSPGIPSLSGLDGETRESIELACITHKADGPMAYGGCLRAQLQSIGIQTSAANGAQPARPKRINRKAALISSGPSTHTFQTTPREHRAAPNSWQDPMVWALLIIAFIYLTPIIWVLLSRRSHGGAKFGWFMVILFFSWLGLAVFLIVTQAQRNRSSTY